MLKLDVTKRDAQESVEALRKRGMVPAVFYGPKEMATPVSVEEGSLKRVWRAAGETAIISLSGVGEQKETLIRDMQFHPVTGSLLHADFYVLEKGKKITISVPLEFMGSAPAEKAGAVIVKTMHEVEIDVSPAELPQHLVVDLSKLELVDDHILASDIALPSSATLITDRDEIVALAKAFQEEKEGPATPVETIITTGAAASEADAGAHKAEDKGASTKKQ